MLNSLNFNILGHNSLNRIKVLIIKINAEYQNKENFNPNFNVIYTVRMFKFRNTFLINEKL